MIDIRDWVADNSLILEKNNLAWIILGLHVDLRCRVGQVEAQGG